jgi:hypothetical protein
MRHRYASVGSDSQSSGDSRNDFKRNPFANEPIQFLGGPSKNTGVTPLKPYHCLAEPGMIHDHIIDFTLFPDPVSTVLSDRNPFGLETGKRAKSGICKTIVQNHVRLSQQFSSANRN